MDLSLAPLFAPGARGRFRAEQFEDLGYRNVVAMIAAARHGLSGDYVEDAIDEVALVDMHLAPRVNCVEGYRPRTNALTLANLDAYWSGRWTSR